MGEVTKFKRMAKERHVLFVQDVKKVREDVNFKIQELREDTVKEIAVAQQDYALNQQVDIIADVVTKFVKLYEMLSPQITQLSTQESQSLAEITSKLKYLKALMLKSTSC